MRAPDRDEDGWTGSTVLDLQHVSSSDQTSPAGSFTHTFGQEWCSRPSTRSRSSNGCEQNVNTCHSRGGRPGLTGGSPVSEPYISWESGGLVLQRGRNQNPIARRPQNEKAKSKPRCKNRWVKSMVHLMPGGLRGGRRSKNSPVLRREAGTTWPLPDLHQPSRQRVQSCCCWATLPRCSQRSSIR